MRRGLRRVLYERAPESASAPGDGSIGFAVTVRNGWDGLGPVQGAATRTGGVLAQEDRGFTAELPGGDRPFHLDVSTTDGFGAAPHAATRGTQTENRRLSRVVPDGGLTAIRTQTPHRSTYVRRRDRPSGKRPLGAFGTVLLALVCGQKLGFIACVPDPADNSPHRRTPPDRSFTKPTPDLQKAAGPADRLDCGSHRSGLRKTGVPLVFKHVLTAIRFRVSMTATGMELRNIRSISLRNVRYKGSFRVNAAGAGSGTPAVAWTLDPAVHSYTDALAPETGDLPEDKGESGYAEPGHELTDADGVFMLPPQTPPADAQIVIEYTLPGEEELQTMTADIGGTEWPIGKTVVYNLSSSKITTEDILEVPTDDIVLTHRGGTAAYAVRSYRKAGARQGRADRRASPDAAGMVRRILDRRRKDLDLPVSRMGDRIHGSGRGAAWRR